MQHKQILPVVFGRYVLFALNPSTYIPNHKSFPSSPFVSPRRPSRRVSLSSLGTPQLQSVVLQPDAYTTFPLFSGHTPTIYDNKDVWLQEL